MDTCCTPEQLELLGVTAEQILYVWMWGFGSVLLFWFLGFGISAAVAAIRKG